MRKADTVFATTEHIRSTASLSFANGHDHYLQGNIQQAIALFTQAIQRDNNYLKAYYGRGICYLTLGQLDNAIADFSYIINSDPNLHLHLFSFKQLQINVTYITPYLLRAKCYSLMNDLKKAVVDYDVWCQQYQQKLNQQQNCHSNLANTDNRFQVIHLAAINNDVTLLDFLINQEKKDVNAVCRYNKTALHYAASFFNIDALKFLLGQENINIKIADNEGKTAYEHIITEGEENPVELMQCFENQFKSKLTQQECDELLFYAIFNSFTYAIDYLIELNLSNLNALDEGDHTFLEALLDKAEELDDADTLIWNLHAMYRLICRGAKLHPDIVHQSYPNDYYADFYDQGVPNYRLFLGLIVKAALEYGNSPAEVRAFINMLDSNYKDIPAGTILSDVSTQELLDAGFNVTDRVFTLRSNAEKVTDLFSMLKSITSLNVKMPISKTHLFCIQDNTGAYIDMQALVNVMQNMQWLDCSKEDIKALKAVFALAIEKLKSLLEDVAFRGDENFEKHYLRDQIKLAEKGLKNIQAINFQNGLFKVMQSREKNDTVFEFKNEIKNNPL